MLVGGILVVFFFYFHNYTCMLCLFFIILVYIINKPTRVLVPMIMSAIKNNSWRTMEMQVLDCDKDAFKNIKYDQR